MRLASVVAAATLLFPAGAQAADARALVAAARQRIETTDARATGRLVQVDTSGNRRSSAVSLKAHWFPGVLRVLLEVVPSGPAGDQRAKTGEEALPRAGQNTRVSILFEMRPGGQSAIRVFHPGESSPASLPFEKWNEGVLGSDFDYEDFLQSEFYWQGQTFVKSVKVGTKDCDVLKSTPGPANRSHYASVETSFDQKTGYPLYAEKSSRDPSAVKEFTSLGLTQSGGVWSARQVQVKVHGRPGSTLLLFERGSAKANLTLNDFSPEQIARFEDHP